MISSPVVVATRSPGKLRELRALLSSAGVDAIDLEAAGIVESAAEDGLEPFESFEENALSKARYFASRVPHPVLADDSGLVVDALGGAPGVRSRRWSGRRDLAGEALDAANNARLAEALVGVTDRAARYVCVAAFVGDGREIVCRGVVEGRITDVPRGEGGFGYDPWFESVELGKTFAEATLVEKQQVSHRGRAFAALIEAVSRG